MNIIIIISLRNDTPLPYAVEYIRVRKIKIYKNNDY